MWARRVSWNHQKSEPKRRSKSHTLQPPAWTQSLPSLQDPKRHRLPIRLVVNKSLSQYQETVTQEHPQSCPVSICNLKVPFIQLDIRTTRYADETLLEWQT